MASISKIKRNKGYTYRVFIRRKGLNPISKVFSTRELANQFINRIEGNRELLLAYGGSRDYQIILKELVDKYLKDEYSGGDAQKQATRLRFWVNRYGHKFISEITRTDISSGLYELSHTLTNATVNRYRSAISVVFSYACRHLELPDNPVRHIPSKPENNERVRFLSEAERLTLFKACRASRWNKLYLLVLLAVTTGARRGELLGLKWCNIDLYNNSAYVETSKNGQPRVLPLTKVTTDELKLFVQDGDVLVFGSSIKPHKPFCFDKSWREALNAAEVKDFTFHSLRHTTASYLAQSGASILEVATILGHKNISVTKRYSHLTIDHKQTLINSVLGGISDTEYVPKQH